MEQAGHSAWLNTVVEEALEPDLPIVDAHHHIWYNHPSRKEVGTYMLKGKRESNNPFLFRNIFLYTYHKGLLECTRTYTNQFTCT